MNGYTVALFIATLMSVITCIVWRCVVFERQIRKVQRYPLFASRDEFVLLKIDGYFKQDPGLYKVYCDFINMAIVHSKEFNFLTMVSNMSATSEPSKKFQEFRHRVEKAPIEVQEADLRLLHTVMDLVVANSTLLRVILWIRFKPSRVWAVIPNFFKKMEFAKPVGAYAGLENCLS